MPNSEYDQLINFSFEINLLIKFRYFVHPVLISCLLNIH